MYDRYDQFDMAHALTTNFLLCYFYPTAITNNTFVTDTLIFTTVTLIILYRAKDSLTEQTIAFRLVRPVVNGFRLQNFTVRPLQDIIGRRQADGDAVKVLL
jgi:hypothetical protein